MRSALLHLAFFVSGAAALVYEVLWMRRFTVLLGATAPATAATLSAMFLGIGLGSALFGIVAARSKRPLVAFGLLEAGIAGGALCVEPLLGAVEGLLAPAAVSPDRPAVFLAVRMVMSMAAILPPAILMGGSLPVLAQAIDRGRLGLGVLGGGLYAANTFGAAAGALAVPVVLLPALGGAGSLRVAMGASLSVALLSFLLDAASRREGGGAPDARVGPAPRERTAPGSTGGLLLAAAFFSGAVGLGLEVLGTRMVALVHENSVYSFATVLAVFLTGIAAGAAASRAMLARRIAPRTIVGAGWVGAGACVVAAPSLFYALTAGLSYAGGSEGLLRHELEIGGLAVATLLPATLLAGTVLPALMEMVGGDSAGPVSRPLGVLLCANTLGAIVGPAVMLFVVGPGLGLWWGLVLCGILQMAAGAAALAARPGRTRPSWRFSWYALGAAGAVVIVLWRPGDLPRVRLDADERLVHLDEGPFGTVAVVDTGDHRRLMLNNFYVLGGTASIGEERLQAHIPLLLHPAPDRVAFLGLGTGITASAALFHPVREVVAMELVGEVVSAARDHFRQANLGVLEDARVRVAVEDARTGLRRSPGRFDVIVGDLVVPWRRGEAALYTLESFASARRALAPGGIFCQWLPMFQLSRREFDSIAATFLDVFPSTVLWKGDFRAGEAAVALVGLTSREPLDPGAIDARSRLYARAPDPANPYLVSPAGLWVFLAGSLSPGDPALRDAPRSRDDRPIVELGSPAAQFSAGHEGGSMLVREPLKAYLEALLAQPLAGTPLERLDDVHLRWRLAGAEIWSASLLELQGRRAEADAVGLGGISKLPEDLRRALGAGVAPTP